MSSPDQSDPTSTPPSEESEDNMRSRAKTKGSKRKRGTEDGQASRGRRRRSPQVEMEIYDVEEREEGDDDAYDPNQSMQDRRAIQRKLREIQKPMVENPDMFVATDPEALLQYFKNADTSFQDVKQTTEAAVDSRGLVLAAELSSRRLKLLSSGKKAGGIDVDEFLSNCISYMREAKGILDDSAVNLTNTQRQRHGGRSRRSTHGVRDDNDCIGDAGDMLDWAHFGRFVCSPSIRRPPTIGFLRAPLSRQPKVRKKVAHSRALNVGALPITRPQVIDNQDLQQKESGDLTAVCGRVYKRLGKIIDRTDSAVLEALSRNEIDANDDQERAALYAKHEYSELGGIELLRFVVDPDSFGQTVENLFHVSFLIREGLVGIQCDPHGFPILLKYSKTRAAKAAGHAKAQQRYQAVLSIDMETWRDAIEAYDIREAMIPHREEARHQGPGAKSWYT